MNVQAPRNSSLVSSNSLVVDKDQIEESPHATYTISTEEDSLGLLTASQIASFEVAQVGGNSLNQIYNQLKRQYSAAFPSINFDQLSLQFTNEPDNSTIVAYYSSSNSAIVLNSNLSQFSVDRIRETRRASVEDVESKLGITRGSITSQRLQEWIVAHEIGHFVFEKLVQAEIQNFLQAKGITNFDMQTVYSNVSDHLWSMDYTGSRAVSADDIRSYSQQFLNGQINDQRWNNIQKDYKLGSEERNIDNQFVKPLLLGGKPQGLQNRTIRCIHIYLQNNLANFRQ